MANNQDLKSKMNKFKENDEIDLRTFKNFFLRNIKLIGAFSFVFLFVASFYSLTIKKTFAGKFQIVLNQPTNSLMNPQLSNLLGNKKKSYNLVTEVGILESPSLLMPIFDFVVSENKNIGLRFQEWKKNLVINLEQGTSILNIEYMDKDKELIIPVLDKISFAYQEYSGSKKKRNIYLTKKYLDGQIDIFKDKSNKSLKEAQKYGIEQDLILDTQSEKKKGSNSDLFNINRNISIEKIRVNAANKIRKIDAQISKIKEIGKDYEKLQYIGSTIPALVDEGLPARLGEIEKKLVRTRVLFTDNDIKVISLVKERDLLIKLLTKRAIGYLEVARLEEEARMQAAMRPEGVIQKYKELMRAVQRDEETLVNLEGELRAAELEEARLEDPWNLITKPTLKPNPVKPIKKIIALQGLILGLIIGSLVAFYKEKKSGILFDDFELENLLDAKIVSKINILSDQNFLEDKKIIQDLLSVNSTKNIRFIKTESISESNISVFSKKFISKNKNIFFDNNLVKSDETDIFILLTSSSGLTYKEIYNLKKRADILNISFYKIFFII